MNVLERRISIPVWASIVVLFVPVALFTLGYRADQANQEFRQGICQLVVGSNASNIRDKQFLDRLIERARNRAVLDAAAGLDLQADADLQSARFYQHYANKIPDKPITLPTC